MTDRLGKLLVALGLVAMLAAYVHGGRVERCGSVNHSGVAECHLGPYTGLLPIEFMAVSTASYINL